MASGDTLATFSPQANEPPTSNFATLDTLNSRPCLNFDATTQEAAIFSGVMPRNYGGGGVTVYLEWAAASATSGTIGWDVTFEANATATDLTADGFATAQTVTAGTVAAAAGTSSITNVAITVGAAGTDSVAAGNPFRLRIRRDVANDTATGDARLFHVEVKET